MNTPGPTDLEALRVAILLYRDEDTPRRIYADALLDRNGPGDAALAAFITHQLDHPDERAVVPPGQGLWHGPDVILPPTKTTLAMTLSPTLVFRRGFVDEVVLPTEDYVGPEVAGIARLQPVRVVRVRGRPPTTMGASSVGWVRRPSGRSPHYFALRPDLFDALTGGVLVPSEPPLSVTRRYPSAAEAEQALTVAILSLSRSAG